jgi:polysaccharide export outer membrane protein
MTLYKTGYLAYLPLLFAATTLAAGEEGVATPQNRGQGRVVIGPDDTVTLSVTSADELSKPWRVGSGGYLNLPLVGRVHAAGMTVEELEGELISRLKRYIVEPRVIVYISEFRSEPVTISGAVERPGITQIQGASGLFEVLMRAGGPKNAGSTVTVTRKLDRGGPIPHPAANETDGSAVLTLNLTEVMQGRGPAADLPIKPGDIISVSDVKDQKLVYIVGEVHRPGSVELVTQDSVSLLRVLGASGGLTRTAAPKGAFIRHTGLTGAGTGKETTSRVNIQQVLAGKAPDVSLRPGDIVIIPPSRLRSYLSVASQSALTTGIYVLARF